MPLDGLLRRLRRVEDLEDPGFVLDDGLQREILVCGGAGIGLDALADPLVLPRDAEPAEPLRDDLPRVARIEDERRLDREARAAVEPVLPPRDAGLQRMHPFDDDARVEAPRDVGDLS